MWDTQKPGEGHSVQLWAHRSHFQEGFSGANGLSLSKSFQLPFEFRMPLIRRRQAPGGQGQIPLCRTQQVPRAWCAQRVPRGHVQNQAFASLASSPELGNGNPFTSPTLDIYQNLVGRSRGKNVRLSSSSNATHALAFGKPLPLFSRGLGVITPSWVDRSSSQQMHLTAPSTGPAQSGIGKCRLLELGGLCLEVKFPLFPHRLPFLTFILFPWPPVSPPF